MGVSTRRSRQAVFPALLCLILAGLLGCNRAEGVADATEPAGSKSAGSAPAAQKSRPADTPRARAQPEKKPNQATADDARARQPAPAPAREKAVIPHPFPGAKKAPSLDGGVGWINTAGPLSLEDLRGKFVLLDFWTYCCINCIHILPELKKLEAAYPNEVVVIGVHSAKFDTEEQSQNIREAVLRYEIEHPVVNDAHHAIWQRYGISSWPSLRVIDPEGNLVAGDSGEVEFAVLDQFFKMAIPYYRQKGVLDETPLRFDLEKFAAGKTPLRYPGKVLADEAGGRLFIADSNHNRLVIADLEGNLQAVVGSGEIGRADGSCEQASFNKPQGMALKDEVLYVADTENHLLRKVDLRTKQVSTVAGLGHQGRNPWPGLERAGPLGELSLPERFVGRPEETALNSPWALWIHSDDLYIAMAGPHQIWKMTLDGREIGPYAGNGREDIVDGPLLPKRPYDQGYSSFAQPSGLASDGQWLYVADSEGSSIRAVPFDPAGKVRTVVGTAHLPHARLFTFGDVDGRRKQARLQHALGVVFYEDRLYVADTYNNKIKEIDLRGEIHCRTLVGDGQPGTSDNPPRFDEPAGLSAAKGKLYVADTNNHLIRTVDLRNGNRVATLEIKGLKPPQLPEPQAPTHLPGAKEVELPPARLRPHDGSIRLTVKLQLPEGYKINPRAPMSYRVEPATAQGAVSRQVIGRSVRVEEPAAEFEVVLPVEPSGKDKLKLSLTYYYCQEGAEGLCKVGSVAWVVPIEVAADANQSNLRLEHRVE